MTREEAIRFYIDEASNAFQDIRSDWSDPRSSVYHGQTMLTTALRLLDGGDINEAHIEEVRADRAEKNEAGY